VILVSSARALCYSPPVALLHDSPPFWVSSNRRRTFYLLLLACVACCCCFVARSCPTPAWRPDPPLTTDTCPARSLWTGGRGERPHSDRRSVDSVGVSRVFVCVLSVARICLPRTSDVERLMPSGENPVFLMLRTYYLLSRLWPVRAPARALGKEGFC